MTEAELRQLVIGVMQSWVGKRESDGSHKSVIDLYNSHKPLARGYAVKYTDEWCATTMSAVAIQLGLTDIMPLECSCSKMITIAQSMGIWVENDAYVPNVADEILYDWNDTTGSTSDNTGSPDHIGMVESVSNGLITVIEGNKNESVSRRVIAVNGKYIRGFICPKYATKASGYTSTKPLVNTSDSTTFTAPTSGMIHNDRVGKWQHAWNVGFDVLGTSNKLEEDCYFGAKSQAFAKAHTVYRNIKGCPTAVKWVQEVVGASVDGVFGSGTEAKVIAWQKAHNLIPDGVFGVASITVALM